MKNSPEVEQVINRRNPGNWWGGSEGDIDINGHITVSKSDNAPENEDKED